MATKVAHIWNGTGAKTYCGRRGDVFAYTVPELRANNYSPLCERCDHAWDIRWCQNERTFDAKSRTYARS